MRPASYYRLQALYSTNTDKPDTHTFMELYKRATDEFRLGNLEACSDFSRKALEEGHGNKAVNFRDMAAVHLNLAHSLKLISYFPEALENAEKALKSLDAHFSSNKLEVCHALDVVAELACELGDNKRARECIDRAIEVKARVAGASGLLLAKSYNIRGAIHLNQGSTAQARSDFIRALGINIRHHGRGRPLPLSVGITMSNISGVLKREADRLPETIALYREVVESFESALSNNETSWMVGASLMDLAEVLLETNTQVGTDEAKDLLARSLHIFLVTRGPDHPSTARASELFSKCGNMKPVDEPIETSLDFVDNLLNECEKVIPKEPTRVSGDIVFLDKRGHVGQGHPHTPLF